MRILNKQIDERNASTIWQKYFKEGESAIKFSRRDHQKGEKRKLTAKQEFEIKKEITEKASEQLKLAYTI